MPSAGGSGGPSSSEWRSTMYLKLDGFTPPTYPPLGSGGNRVCIAFSRCSMVWMEKSRATHAAPLNTDNASHGSGASSGSSSRSTCIGGASAIISGLNASRSVPCKSANISSKASIKLAQPSSIKAVLSTGLGKVGGCSFRISAGSAGSGSALVSAASLSTFFEPPFFGLSDLPFAGLTGPGEGGGSSWLTTLARRLVEGSGSGSFDRNRSMSTLYLNICLSSADSRGGSRVTRSTSAHGSSSSSSSPSTAGAFLSTPPLGLASAGGFPSRGFLTHARYSMLLSSLRCRDTTRVHSGMASSALSTGALTWSMGHAGESSASVAVLFATISEAGCICMELRKCLRCASKRCSRAWRPAPWHSTVSSLIRTRHD
mmetsp:Transcript_14298/g.27444  ORF Transcript_14298/g.27444 Transcript_14298/m.27444 type:complete len:372 (-) Transcript_14298:208-1323(-)